MHTRFEEGVALSSGTAGLVVALRSLGCPGAWIAVPPTVCPNVVAAVLAADCRVHFIDIERGSLGIDPEELRREITGVRAVIAVHAYGEPCRIAEIVSICRPAGVVVIEDCAQADGAANEQGRPVGTLGDIAVFSYGTGKIIDLGGGGIVVGRTPAILHKLQMTAEALPASRSAGKARIALDAMNQAYKNLYNEFYPAALSAKRDAFTRLLQNAAQDGAVPASFHERDAIIVARKNRLRDTIYRRHRKCHTYRARLSGVNEVQFLHTSQNGAPWRFNCWLRGPLRDHVLRGMLKQGMKVSSWHPDIRPFLSEGVYRSGVLTNAAWLSEGVLNLWVDDKTSVADIVRTSDEISTRIASWHLGDERKRDVSEI